MKTAATVILVTCAAPAAFAQCIEECTAIHTWTGEATGDQFGWVSNEIGDLDDDDINDLLLTAPTNDAGGSNAGRVYVYSGATGIELFRLTGSAGWWLGHDAAGAGDVNRDGIPDIIVGAPFSGTGRAIIYSGNHGIILHTFPGEASGDQFGYRVWGGQDFNGDGWPDVVIGANQHDGAGINAGRAYIYSGQDFSLICSIDGPTASDLFGSGVAFIGDISQPPDGRDDVLIGARNAGPSAAGRAYVYSYDGESCQFEYELDPGSPATDFGLWFMNGGFDVNNDGTPDMYVNDFQVNRAHVFSGVDGTKIWSLTGDGNGQFGIGRMIEDVNGDHHADLLLAAWISPAGGANAGKAFVYSGQTAEVMDTYTHNVPGAGFGFDANGMGGDVNGDGRSDYLITAASYLSSRGRAFLIAGEIAPTDFNGDLVVNVADLVTVILNWGPCPGGEPCLGDTNSDGIVNVLDLTAVILNWG